MKFRLHIDRTVRLDDDREIPACNLTVGQKLWHDGAWHEIANRVTIGDEVSIITNESR